MSVYLHDAILMGADSRITTDEGFISDDANKVFVTENHVGICVCGHMEINNISMESYMNEFIDAHKNSTVTEISHSILPFFKALDDDLESVFQVAGYEPDDTGSLIQKKFRIFTEIQSVKEITMETGLLWNGIQDIITQLIKDSYWKDNNRYILLESHPLDFKSMRIQQGIDLIRFLIKTTEGMMSFQNRRQGVGGDIDILLITPQGHQWISHKQLH